MKTKEISNVLQVLKKVKENGLHCFEIVGVEDGQTFNAFETLPREIGCDEYEYTYALMEHEKDVMALGVGQSMYFQPCRDDKTSRAIVVRIM